MPKVTRPNKPTNAPRDAHPTFRIDSMAYGGWGVARGKRPVFIPYTIEGESVTARLVRQEKTVDYADGVTLLHASSDRVYPSCSHFGAGKCWGCQWQHISETVQPLIKFDVLINQLYRYGTLPDSVLERVMKPTLASPHPWRYNHHASFKQDPKTGKFGFLRQDGRTIEPISACMVLHEDLQAFYESLDIEFDGIGGFSLYRGEGGETMLVLEMLNETLPELSADIATSANVLLPDNEPVNLFGESFVRFNVAGRSFRMTAGGFFRPNVAQIESLVGVVLAALALSPTDSILELYAGVGTLSAFIAPRVSTLTAIESYPPAVTDLDENLAEFDNVDVIEGSVEEFLGALKEDGAGYDAVVIDAPPQGMSDNALGALLALKIQRVVYIASNPASLWKTTFALLGAGYRLALIQPIDFAPQTFYIESVAVFERD